MMRVSPALILVPALFLAFGCDWTNARQADQVLGLTQRMGAELKSEAARATAIFSGRDDFEELRRAFGGEGLDVGTPLGPDFQGSLDTLIRDLNLQLEKETKDADFTRKAARRVRKLSQWWAFVRIHLEARRDQLTQAPENPDAHRLLGIRLRRPDILTVLSEIIKVVATFESITIRCVHGIEDIIITRG